MIEGHSARQPDAPPTGWARLAHGRWATPLLCLLSFTDACVSPIIPEVVLVPMVLARPEQRWRYALLVSAASVLGGVCGYLLGMTLWDAGLDRVFFDYVPGFTPERFASASHEFGERTFWVMFAAGFTPLPYKLFTVVAGVCHEDVGFATFAAASVLSRFLRFFLTVWLLHQFGRRVLERASRRVTVVFGVLVVVAVLALLWVGLR